MPDTNSDIIKLAVRKLQCFPINDRPAPLTDAQYREELCRYLGISRPPQRLYIRARELYIDIFVNGYQNTCAKIKELIRQTTEKRAEAEAASAAIINGARYDHPIKKDIRSFEDALTTNYFKMKELNALYDDKNNIECGLLPYYQKSLESLLKRFCGEIGVFEKADEKLRQIVLDCIRDNDDNDTVDDRLHPYKTVLEKFDYLLADTPELTLKRLFYKVKFLPFAARIEDTVKKKAFQAGKIHNKDEIESVLAEIRRGEEEHLLYPESLIRCADSDLGEYLSVLEATAPEAAAQIREALLSSSCLSKRRSLIERSLQLLEARDDEVVMYLMPIQIEGLFGDLFEYSNVYALNSDMGRYQTIIHSELVKTIQMSVDENVNLTLDAVAYFKYYFSSIVRNTVAHGKHKLLVERWQIDRGECENEYSDAVYKRIIVLELLLDLNFLIQSIACISEVDAAAEYVNTTAHFLTERHDDDNGSPYFGCLLSDLTGERESLHKNRYKSGIFTSYDPLQILFWCFNPYFERYFDDGGANLNIVRSAICSSDFWDYVIDELSSRTFQEKNREHLQLIIKNMFRLKLPLEICTRLKKANELLQTPVKN